ncbi:MAG TPA: tetratricopeptide repeat protein [Phycisphaerae bacterium]|nr:tetratricopeptide repeat protein [Phycisphaerae bacterium]
MSDSLLPPSQPLEEPALQSPASRTIPPIAAPIFLLLLVVLAFYPAVFGGYTWDDGAWLTDNINVRSPHGLSAIWNPAYQVLHYYPLIFSTYWIEFRLWGLNPLGYHLVNILLHAASAILLYKILRRLGLRAALPAAALWAIHPVQVDTVAWVAELKNVLSGLFYFASALLYLRFANIPSPDITEITATTDITYKSYRNYILSLLLFLAALLSKTVTCTLPAALFLILLWKKPKRSPRTFLPLIPFFILGLGLAFFTTRQEAHVVQTGQVQIHLSLWQRTMVAGLDVFYYLRTLLFPYPLVPIPPKWDVLNPSPLAILAPFAALAIALLLWLLRRRLSLAPFIAYAFFLITLSPALGYIDFYTMLYSFVADHYQYFACLGPLALFAEFLYLLTAPQHIPQTPSPRPRLLPFLPILLLLPVTLFHSWIYQSNMRMWEWNVARNPNAWNARHNLAVAYIGANRPDDAFTQLRAAIALYDSDARIHRTLGQLYADRGQTDLAVAEFRRSLELDKTDSFTYESLGKFYLNHNMEAPALAAFAKATELQPTNAREVYNFAQALSHFHKLADAETEYRLAIALDPTDFAARYNLANLLLDTHRTRDAIAEYLALLQRHPDSADAWNNLAAAYYEDGQLDKALAAKQKVRDLDAAAPATQPTNGK